MKFFLVLLGVLLLGGVSQAQDRPEFMNVPFSHWSYQCAQKLLDSGLVHIEVKSNELHATPMTRYEFAVLVCRIVDSRQQEIKALLCGGKTALDCLYALHQEFLPEIKHLGVKIDFDKVELVYSNVLNQRIG